MKNLSILGLNNEQLKNIKGGYGRFTTLAMVSSTAPTTTPTTMVKKARPIPTLIVCPMFPLDAVQAPK